MNNRIRKAWPFVFAAIVVVLIAYAISCAGVKVEVQIPEIFKDEVLNEYVTITTANATPSEHKTQDSPFPVEQGFSFDFQIKKADGIQFTVDFRGQEIPHDPDAPDDGPFVYSIDLTQTASGTYAIHITASRKTPYRTTIRNAQQARIWIQVFNSPPEAPVYIQPQDGATHLPVQNLVFSWEAAADPDPGDEVFYLFYLGRSEDDLALQATPTHTSYTHPGPLEYDTQYFWQVVAEDGKKVLPREGTPGSVWRFTTKPDLPTVTVTVQSHPHAGGDVQIEERGWTKEDAFEVYKNTSCTIHARASAGYLFDGWYVEGSVVSRATTLEILVEEDILYQARFVEFGDFQPPEMVFVAKTHFEMGDNQGDLGPENRPVHEVRLSYSYRISKIEVTINQYQAFLSGTQVQIESSLATRETTRPIAMVNWWDAVAFCNWLSDREGLAPAYDEEGNLLDKDGTITQDISLVEGYRLPTEAEWELAARGGGWPSGNYRYSGSDTVGDVAWYQANSNADGTGRRAQKVESKGANDLGLHDMSGNVREWCHDWYGSYSEGLQEDPIGPQTGTHRVIRGGGWDEDANACRIAARDHGLPDYQSETLGFRLARTEIPPADRPVIRWKEDEPPAPPHRPPIVGDQTTEEIVADQPLASVVVRVNGVEQVIDDPQHIEETDEGEHIYSLEINDLQPDEENPVEVVAINAQGLSSDPIQRNFARPRPTISNARAEVQECEGSRCQVYVHFESNQELNRIVYTVGGSDKEESDENPLGFLDEETGLYSYSFSVRVDEGEFSIHFSGYNDNGFGSVAVDGTCDCNVPPILQEDDFEFEVEDCEDDQCAVTIRVWANQALTHVVLQKEDEEAAEQETGKPIVIGNNYQYTVVTTVGAGLTSISLQGKNANGLSNTITFTVECNCTVPTPDPPVIEEMEVFIHPCEEEECMVSITFISDQQLDKAQATVNDGDSTDYELDELPNAPDGLWYQFFIAVPAGQNTIAFAGVNENGASNVITVSAECNCQVPSAPTISFDPQDPPPDETADQKRTIPIISDQELTEILSWINGTPKEPIESPVFEENPDGSFLYGVPVTFDLKETNEVEIQGKNPLGSSNRLSHSVGMQPAVIEAVLGSVICNAENDGCDVEIQIASSQELESLQTTPLGGTGETHEDLEPIPNPADPNRYHYSIVRSVPTGAFYLLISGSNALGRSSNIPTVEGDCVCEVPQVPGPFSLRSPTHSAYVTTDIVQLEWDASTGAIDYDVFFGAGDDPSFVKTVTTPTAEVEAPEEGQNYRWKVRANNPAGSTWGTGGTNGVMNFTRMNPPGAFSMLSPADGSTVPTLSVLLEWEPSAGATTYDLFFGLGEDPSLVQTLTTPTAEVEAPQEGQDYRWKVRANNPAGSTWGTGGTNGVMRFTRETPVQPQYVFYNTIPASLFPKIWDMAQTGDGGILILTTSGTNPSSQEIWEAVYNTSEGNFRFTPKVQQVGGQDAPVFSGVGALSNDRIGVQGPTSGLIYNNNGMVDKTYHNLEGWTAIPGGTYGDSGGNSWWTLTQGPTPDSRQIENWDTSGPMLNPDTVGVHPGTVDVIGVFFPGNPFLANAITVRNDNTIGSNDMLGNEIDLCAITPPNNEFIQSISSFQVNDEDTHCLLGTLNPTTGSSSFVVVDVGADGEIVVDFHPTFEGGAIGSISRDAPIIYRVISDNAGNIFVSHSDHPGLHIWKPVIPKKD